MIAVCISSITLPFRLVEGLPQHGSRPLMCGHFWSGCIAPLSVRYSWHCPWMLFNLANGFHLGITKIVTKLDAISLLKFFCHFTKTEIWQPCQSKYLDSVSVCLCLPVPFVISSIPGKSFHFPFPYFVIFVLRYFPFHVVGPLSVRYSWHRPWKLFHLANGFYLCITKIVSKFDGISLLKFFCHFTKTEIQREH